MKLRFNEGAIVRFDLIDGETISGKVRRVLDDEVELIDQVKILNGNSNMYYNDRTVDGKKVIHLRRQLIKSWQYENPLSFSKRVDETLKDWFTGDDYSDSLINSYVNDICEGCGKWCGDIEEYASAVIILPKHESDFGDEEAEANSYF